MLARIQAGKLRSGRIQANYSGAGAHLAFFQGFGAGTTMISAFPEPAKGSIVLADGSTAVWLRGVIRSRSSGMGFADPVWSDDPLLSLFWETDGPGSWGYRLVTGGGGEHAFVSGGIGKGSQLSSLNA
jgi:hypothetical protein